MWTSQPAPPSGSLPTFLALPSPLFLPHQNPLHIFDLQGPDVLDSSQSMDIDNVNLDSSSNIGILSSAQFNPNSVTLVTGLSISGVLCNQAQFFKGVFLLQSCRVNQFGSSTSLLSAVSSRPAYFQFTIYSFWSNQGVHTIDVPWWGP